MLRPITNWKMLTTALQAMAMGIYRCEDCGHVWLSADSPVRCPRRDCRAWANYFLRDSVGRPPTAKKS